MKTLEELRKAFVEARKIALENNVSNINIVIEKVDILLAHCKELCKLEPSILKQARAEGLYKSIEQIKAEMLKSGYESEAVIKFFGLPPKKVEMPITSPFADAMYGSDASTENNMNGDVASILGDVQPTYEQPLPLDVGGDEQSLFLEPEDEQSSNLEPSDEQSLFVGSLDEEPSLLEPIDEQQEPMDSTDISFDDLDSNSDSDYSLLEPSSDVEEQPMYDLPMIQDNPMLDEAPIAEDVNDVIEEDRQPKTFVPSENALEPNSFDDFIGQTHIVNRLRQEVLAAKILGKKHLDNILLLGNKGLGKSTLMEIIAKELGVGYEYIDCTSFSAGGKGEANNFHSFMLRIINENKPVVLGFDEIHAMPDKIQDRLLIMLQKRKYSYVEKGMAHNLDMPEFTFIGATTDYDVIREPVKDRCSNLTFTMEDYTRDELSQILCNKFATMGLEADGDVIERCVNRFRSSLRDIKAVVMGIYTKTVLEGVNIVTAEMAESYFTERGLDAIGLNKKELEILNAIKDDPKGVVSEDTLAGRVYLDVKIFKAIYEPYLNKIGFITTTSRGRELTQKALDYLNYGYYDFGNGYSIGINPRKEAEDK